MLNPFKKNHEVTELPTTYITAALRAVDSAPEPVVERPEAMVLKVQGLVGSTLDKLVRQEAELVNHSAIIAERLRQVRVSIDALALANDVLLDDITRDTVQDAFADAEADASAAAALAGNEFSAAG
jgi:hypothetical protein